MKRIEEAVAYAAKMHAGQTRKMTGMPYILHPMETAVIVTTMTMDEDVIIASILHDVIEDTPAWMPALRSRTAIRMAAKRQFSDPSIPASVLGANPDGLMHDVVTLGFLFESMCCRDLRVYAQTKDGRVSHFRDRNGLEIDLVVSLPDGRWGGVEVKLGGGRIDEAAGNLLKVAKRIDVSRMGKPSFLMVLTGTKFAFRRPDGVYVVPLGCLKP